MTNDCRRFFFSLLVLMTITVTTYYTLHSTEQGVGGDRPLLHSFQGRRATPEEKGPSYLIETPGCTIPDTDPDDPSIVEYKLKTPWTLECSKYSPLTEESGLSLLFHEERIHQYGLPRNSVVCSYQGIVRVEQTPGQYNERCDNKWRLKEKIPIKARETAISEDGILVTCEDLNWKFKKPFYKNVHHFLQPSRVQEKRLSQTGSGGGGRWQRLERLSVIVMGIDSMSRGNLRRHMPLTFDYLINHLGAVDLRGYTKIADGTDNNLMAVVMGLSAEELSKHSCLPQGRLRFDDCPMIWKDFAAEGYATAFADDAPSMGVFHFHTDGFCKEPTDFYNRPYFSASDGIIGHAAGRSGYAGYPCQGGRNSMSLIYNYSLNVAHEVRNLPHFGFYWTSSITHDFLEGASMADRPSLEYLERLSDGGFLEHTILFFISDHGLRWGKFRETVAGMMEERMPYVMIVFPKWFVDVYPEAMANLRTNEGRLTSPFDLHATFHAILNRDYGTSNRSLPDLKHGYSLFQDVPPGRTCADAGVPEHYCTCGSLIEIDASDPRLREAATEAIRDVNKGLRAFPQCVQLQLDKVLRGWVRSSGNDLVNGGQMIQAEAVVVTFVTQPGGAKLEATLRRRDGKYKLTFEMSRVNQYGNQSRCVRDRFFRKFCFCKNQLGIKSIFRFMKGG